MIRFQGKVIAFSSSAFIDKTKKKIKEKKTNEIRHFNIIALRPYVGGSVGHHNAGSGWIKEIILDYGLNILIKKENM